MEKIYLIHGSLGAGKTTLVNKMLSDDFFSKSVVIENEFASFSVDDYLINKRLVLKDTKTIAGGCICCASGKEFMNILSEVSRQNDIEKIIIESTGVANSIEIIKQIILSVDYDIKYEFGANIMLVDALEDDLDNLASNKINEVKIADLVLITKTDLVSNDKKNKILDLIYNINKNVHALKKGVFNSKKYFNNKFKSNLEKLIMENIDEIFVNNNILLQDNYCVLNISKVISDVKFGDFLKRLADVKCMDIKRVKGFYKNDKEENVVVNGTKNNMQFFKNYDNEFNDNCRLVIIGENIKLDIIESIFNKFIN